jgi:hypothetical protein
MSKKINSLSHKIIIISALYLLIPGALWMQLGYFAKYFSLKGLKVFVLGAFSHTRELLRFPNKLAIVKRFGNYTLFNLQLRIDPLGWLFLTENILGSLPALVVVFRPSVLPVSTPSHDVLPMAYAAWKLSDSRLVINVRDPLEVWLHISQDLARAL